MQGNMMKKFNLTMHHFRGIAIIFVAAEHLLVPYYINSEIGQIYKFLSLTIFSPGSVLFAFIAGYLSVLIESNRFDPDHLVQYGLGYIKKNLRTYIAP